MGDSEARFGVVFEGCYAPLWAYARRRAAPADAEDLVAEVFTVAWRRLDDMPDGDGTLPWLYGVARRTLANQQRGQQRRTRLVARLASHDRPERHDDDVEPAAIAFVSGYASIRWLLWLVGRRQLAGVHRLPAGTRRPGRHGRRP